MRSEEVCIAKIESVSNTHCHVELIFNGATEVVNEEIMLDEAAHIETIEGFNDFGVVVETSQQIGEAGYMPFVDKLKESYPNVVIVDGNMFDSIVAAQKEQADKLGMNDD